jgi:hypothetical protein
MNSTCSYTAYYEQIPPQTGGTPGSGTVTSVGVSSDDFTTGGTNPVSTTGTITVNNKNSITYNVAHTFEVVDRGRLVIMGNDNDFTIPNDTTYNFPIGHSIDFLMQGTNEANEILVEAGVTLRWKGNGIYNPAVPLLLENFTIYTITKIAPNLWTISGGSI